MDKSDYGILEESRRAAIRSAANLLQAADHAKRLRKKLVSGFRDQDDTRPDDGGDFLFDVLRLNANYLNQLAKIGEAHSGTAQRALERLYSLIVPARQRETTAELEFTYDDRAPNKGTMARFAIRNDAAIDSDQVGISPLGFVPSLSRNGTWLKSLKDANDDVVWTYESGEEIFLRVAFGQTAVLTAEVFDDFAGARRYDAELVVEMGAKTRRIPVVLDWRSKRGSP